MIIPNFNGGLVTNAGDHTPRGRENYASYARECRSDKQGWLMRRAGRIRLSDLTGFTDVFVHKTVILAVIAGNLRWARTKRVNETLVFHDFTMEGYRIKEGDERVVFERRDNFVYIGTGKASFVVHIPDPPDVPDVQSFFLEQAEIPNVVYLERSRLENTKLVDLKFQAVYVHDEQKELPTTQGFGIDMPTLANRQVIAPASDTHEIEVRTGIEPVSSTHPIHEFISDIVTYPNPFTAFTNISFEVVRQTPLRIDIFNQSGQLVRTLHDSLGDHTTHPQFVEGDQEIRWHGDNDIGEDVAAGIYVVRFRYSTGLDVNAEDDNDYTLNVGSGISLADFYGNADPDIERTAIKITIEETPLQANYLDIYASYRDNREDFYFIARMPYIEGQELRYVFPFSDPSVADEFIDAGEKIDFQYIELNKFRTYAAEADSNQVYISYYDPVTSTQLYQNFVDVIPLELGSGKITGLRFIRDNLLAVYATNQIQLIATDPLAELHAVSDELGPNDEEGNPIGCIAPDSIIDMGGEHYFLGSNKYVQRFTTRSVRTISDPVQAIFHTLAIDADEYGQQLLSKAVAFAHDRHYFVSIPSLLEGDSQEPNTTMLYSMQYGRWWQDGFGIQSVSKSSGERVYGVIDEQLFELYQGDDDAGEEIRRIWRSNPELRKAYDLLECVNVFCQGSAEIDVKATTEEGTETNHLSVEDAFAFFDQRAGFFLHGRTHQVEIALTGDAKIDRIATNERLST